MPHLLVIGYNVTERRRGYNQAERRRDASYYDLLASEARLAVFVAIAQDRTAAAELVRAGSLARLNAGSGPTLLSWSGSMFEYLMPLIVMPAYDRTLLGESCRAAVQRQIAYGAQRGVPWACRSRATTPWMPASTTSTARSACRDSASSAA